MWWDRRWLGLGYTESKTAMENRLKERLTGAAILVALIVMLVPEMFRGQRSEVSTTAGSSGEGPPVRSYTIDLSNNPKHNGPLQSTAAEPAAAVQPEPTSAQPPKPDPPKAEPVKAEPVKAEPPKTQSAGPDLRTGRAVTAGSMSAAVKASSSASWSVQVGMFGKRENAERMMHEAQGKGFNVAISNVDNKGMYHVRLTGLADRTAAQALSQRMKASGLPAAVVAP
jgi:DedD protein